MQFQRIRYPARKGNFKCNLQWPAIHSDSHVVATISEVSAEGVVAGQRDASRFIGDASLSVLNTAPHDGGVTLRVNIDWDDPLDFAVDFILFD